MTKKRFRLFGRASTDSPAPELYNPDNLTNAQLWTLGLSAILTESNGASHDRLRMSEDAAESSHSIERDWGLTDRQELLAQLDSLRSGGHNERYLQFQSVLSSLPDSAIGDFIALQSDPSTRAQLQIAANYRHVLSDTGIVAWDFGRACWLTRTGLVVGWIDEDECWDLLFGFARPTQQAFTDWTSYGISYVAGRLFWRGIASQARADEEMLTVRWLSSNPANPWHRVAWNEPLVRA